MLLLLLVVMLTTSKLTDDKMACPATVPAAATPAEAPGVCEREAQAVALQAWKSWPVRALEDADEQEEGV